MKKKLLSLLLITVITLTFAGTLSSCGDNQSSNKDKSSFTVAIPNDTTNEARALLLLEKQGFIKLKKNAGITATVKDIEEKGNIEIKEVEAAQVPNTLKDVDFGIINANYAIDSKLNPTKDALAIEDSAASYANILAVKKGNEKSEKTKALIAALESKKVADYINDKYKGGVISTVKNPGNGIDKSIDYKKLKGQKITVAASPTPHAEILKIAKEILKEQDITLEIKEFTDYVQPNNVVESGEVDANYFQHLPYLEDFNKKNKTHIISVASVHNEPMGIYSGKESKIDVLKKIK